MADNYLQFSFAVQLNNEDEREWLETILCGENADGEVPEEFHEAFPDFSEWGSLDFDWEIDGENQLWIHTDDGMGNPSMVADLLQYYLKKFDPKAHVSFEFAETCSKPKLDEFGGGAVVISMDEMWWMSTGQWAAEKIDEIQKGFGGTK